MGVRVSMQGGVTAWYGTGASNRILPTRTVRRSYRAASRRLITPNVPLFWPLYRNQVNPQYFIANTHTHIHTPPRAWPTAAP